MCRKTGPKADSLPVPPWMTWCLAIHGLVSFLLVASTCASHYSSLAKWMPSLPRRGGSVETHYVNECSLTSSKGLGDIAAWLVKIQAGPFIDFHTNQHSAVLHWPCHSCLAMGFPPRVRIESLSLSGLCPTFPYSRKFALFGPIWPEHRKAWNGVALYREIFIL